MTLEELREMVEREVVIDEKNLDSSALAVPELYTKYLAILQDIQLRCAVHQQELASEYKRGWLHYRTDSPVLLSTKDEYRMMIVADDKYQTIERLLKFEKAKAEYVEGVLQQIKGFSFLIRDIIEWRKFQNGYF